jgi:2-(1,2-epoxy-1,2-dihydrophenyl)acetyl-CoA isomerase
VTAHVLRTDPADGVAVLTITRPEVRNALGRQSWIEIRQAADEIAADPQVRAVVLTGGETCFSAGGDIKGMTSGRTGVLAPLDRLALAHQAVRSLDTLPQPLIAAVEGYAIGAGWSIALTCDLVTAGRNVFFQASFLDRALVADCGLVGHLVGQIGRVKTMDLLLTRRRVTVEEAVALNMVSRVVEPGEAVAAAVSQAAEIAALPADAVQLTKRLVRSAARSLDEVLEAETASWALAWCSPDAVEARQAFLEKRSPRFNLDLVTEP